MCAAQISAFTALISAIISSSCTLHTLSTMNTIKSSTTTSTTRPHLLHGAPRILLEASPPRWDRNIRQYRYKVPLTLGLRGLQIRFNIPIWNYGLTTSSAPSLLANQRGVNSPIVCKPRNNSGPVVFTPGSAADTIQPCRSDHSPVLIFCYRARANPENADCSSPHAV
ncbi:hypothetical protein EDC01DRAFT_661407, partial [Geopyxis carbonaria]